MEYKSLVFSNNISMVLLEIENMKLDWVNNVEKNNKIFDELNYGIKSTGGFDYYYINQILIIPDPIPSSRLNWNKTIYIDNLEINCKGKYIAFFYYEEKENFVLVDSLNFPQYRLLKNKIFVK